MLDICRVHDASESLDPTNTEAIRKRFKVDFRKRWDALLKLSTQTIVKNDLLALSGHTTQSIMYGGDKIKVFQEWINKALNQIVYGNNGQWVDSYVLAANKHALLKSKIQAETAKSLPLLISATKIELKGIIEIASQQIVRQVFNGLMARSQASKIARDVASAIKLLTQRTSALVDFMIVKTFNESLLDAFEHAGVQMVGVIPEYVPTQTIQDAKSKKNTDIVTMQDSKVCKVCKKASEDGPYTIKKARGLLPMHFRCRCALVAA